MSRVTEDQFLGALLGVAIGDALGLPVDGMTADEIREMHGEVNGYLEIADAGDGQPISGTISDKTEVALCIVESLTTNDGLLDPENINARLGFLVNGNSRQWMSEEMVRGVEGAAGRDGLVSEEVVSNPEVAVALRGVIVGLLHAIGATDNQALMHDVETATRLSHGGEAAVDLTAQVAKGTLAAVHAAEQDGDWGAGIATNAQIRRVMETVRQASTFEEAVYPVIQAGGEAAALGALAGGLAGAYFGASGIPQKLIDDLDARIYLSMAAPWFYRTVMRRAGTVIDLRMIE